MIYQSNKRNVNNEQIGICSQTFLDVHGSGPTCTHDIFVVTAYDNTMGLFIYYL
jgi:hypothetical protein